MGQVVIVPWTSTILNLLVILTSIFLIFLVLIQRGKGGGLAGALRRIGWVERPSAHELVIFSPESRS